jgi:hypothetical protein
MQWDGAQLAWKDITTSVDPTGMKVYGAITRDYLGALAVSSASPPLSVSVTNKGMDPTKGSYFVDLTILNSSIHSVSSIALDSLSFVTLGGTGTISYNTAIGQPLPQPLPNLAPGASTTYRLYLKSNTAFGRGGVTRFAVTENFRMTDSNGALFSTPYTENVIP